MDMHRPLHLVDRGQGKHLGTFIPMNSFLLPGFVSSKMGVLVAGNKAGSNQATPKRGRNSPFNSLSKSVQ